MDNITQSNENQPEQTNNQTPHNNVTKKGNIIIWVGAGILLLIIILLIILANRKSNTATLPQTPSPTISHQPIATAIPSPSESPEIPIIKNQAKPQLDARIQVSYEISKVKVYDPEWAMLEVRNPSTDPANVVLKKEKGVWKVMLGPGTYISNEQLQAIGAPQNLKDEANRNL